MSENSSPAQSHRSLSQRTQLRIVAVVIALLLVGASALWLARRALTPMPVAASPQAVPGTFRPTKEQWASLKFATVGKLAFRDEVVADGTVAYNDDTTTQVFSPYSGRVTRLVAKPGDLVKQGTPLLTVEASEFAQGQSDVATARAQLKQAETNEQRLHALYLAKAGAQKDWLQAKTDLAAAQATLSAARNRLRILGKSDEEIDTLASGAALSGKHAEGSVLAPIAGSVTQRQVGLGQYITAGGSTPVFSIGNLATVWLIANVREADAPQVRVGEPVEVHVFAFPHRVFEAKIDWVAPAVDAITHRLPVRAQIDNHDGALKPAMFANFSIHASADTLAPALPKSAVVYEGDDAHVFVARDDGSIALKQIRTGRSSGDMIEVTDGLVGGEKIVSSGTLFIDRAVDSGA